MNRPSLLLALCLLATACARSERAPLPGDSVGTDGAVSLATPRLTTNATAPVAREPLSALESRLFPAELVMEHQAAIALLPAQQEAISRELGKTQTELVKLQWELQTEKDKLVKVLDDPKVDEARSRQAAESLMRSENAIKAAHLGMLVRIKNVLTPVQQQKLRALREEALCAPTAAKDAGRD
jgi:Spy/CpxP family protein refolding chaperone